MDFNALMAEIRRLAATTQALAAIGAALRLRQDGEQADAAVQLRLDAFVQATVPDTLCNLDKQQVAMALGFANILFEEAAELLRNPTRPATCGIKDIEMLQAQGRLSRQGFHAIFALTAGRPLLSKTFEGRFLDVGTGVGGIALEAVEQCPSLHAVGIDIWEPALALARANVAASPDATRIEIRTLDVTQLEERDAYTLAWLPTAFMSRSTAEIAIDRIEAALMPGGYLVVGYHTLPTAPAAAAFAALRLVRSGGESWDSAELEQQLQAHGFVDVETCSPIPEVRVRPEIYELGSVRLSRLRISVA